MRWKWLNDNKKFLIWNSVSQKIMISRSLNFKLNKILLLLLLFERYHFAFANEHKSKDDNKIYFWEHFSNLNLGCNCRCIK
jgi:hypothetical protein